MVDGKLMVETGTTMCLGPCGDVDLMKGNIHIGPNQNLRFANFILSTMETSFAIKREDGTLVLTCFSKPAQCVAGVVPSNLPSETMPNGMYITGSAGGEPISAFDPWSVLTTLRLDKHSTISKVELPRSSISGWRLSNSEFTYTFTNRGQLIVGDVDMATIYNSPNNRVIAEGPVLIRNGFKGCPIPIARPDEPTMLLIYIDNILLVEFCDVSKSILSFAFNVEMDQCKLSPSLATSPFEAAYYKVIKTNIAFFTDANCFTKVAEYIIASPCRQGWNGIILPSTPIQT
jgi:hypothetical protein